MGIGGGFGVLLGGVMLQNGVPSFTGRPGANSSSPARTQVSARHHWPVCRLTPKALRGHKHWCSEVRRPLTGCLRLDGDGVGLCSSSLVSTAAPLACFPVGQGVWAMRSAARTSFPMVDRISAESRGLRDESWSVYSVRA